MKEKLQEILDQFNSIYSYNDENIVLLRDLMEQAIKILELSDTQNSSITLTTWINIGLSELKGEIDILKKDPKLYDEIKWKSLYTMARTSGSVALTNIIMHSS